MIRYENSDLEFKREYTSDIKKEVIAFSNAEGGRIYIGVADDGEVVGINNVDNVMTQLVNSLRDTIRPDILPFVKIQMKNIEEKKVIEIIVESGDNKPYYIYEKGLRPSGVYVRKGSTKQSLSDEGIRQMILQNSGIRYETSRSLNQDLTFETFANEMNKRNIELGEVQMKNLHLIGKDGLYTNLGLLLSDQCEHTIKVAYFQGKNKLIFRNRKEFSGSILSQMKQVIEYIESHNKVKATIHGLYRVDKYDYPIDAIRETILNCIVHRDYSFSASTIINVYDNRMEFLSLGGLVNGLSMKAIMSGFSQSRNIHLAELFYRMKLIESFGTGIEKILNLYENERNKPEFMSVEGAFRVILPNRNEEISEVNQVNERYVEYQVCRLSNDYESRIIEFLEDKKSAQRKEIQELLDLKQTRTYEILKDMCNRGILKSSNKGKNTYYELNKEAVKKPKL